MKIPHEIDDAITLLQDEIKQLKFSFETTEKNGLLRFLKKYKNLYIFGFNSSKYDLKCLAPYIYKYCESRKFKPNILKVFDLDVSVFDHYLERYKIFDSVNRH